MRTRFLLLTILASSLTTAAMAYDSLGLPPVRSGVPAAATPTAAVPAPPELNAKAYILIDAQSGKILAEKNSNERMPPASLTKMMTMYLVSEALAEKKLKLDETILISPEAWKTGGSKMFVKVGDRVKVEDLIQGIIIASGNDACVALAEHIAGTEAAFSNLMNLQAQHLGMANSHFTDSTGMPHPEHYTTARDMAILARAIILNHNDDYRRWYKEKWFTYNNIKQPNRNRLLWQDEFVDGVKTGHTDEAGFCLVASKEKDGMRLISVVMGTTSDNARMVSTKALFGYGYRFFETHKLYNASQPIAKPRVWLGAQKAVTVGFERDVFVTVPQGQYQNLKASIDVAVPLKAPIEKGQSLGNLHITLNGEPLTNIPIVALEQDGKGGWWRRFADRTSMTFRRIFHRPLS